MFALPILDVLLFLSVQRSYDEQSMSDGPRYDNEDDRANVRRPFGKDREDKVHDSIIEERIQRERPCRTLFIRNIKASLIF